MTRSTAISVAVSRAVWTLWPALAPAWGVAATLKIVGYDNLDRPGEAWIGHSLHREVLNQFRQLNAGR